MEKPTSVKAYIGSFPEATQQVLLQVQTCIREQLPKDAIECISYGMPAYKTHGLPLVYFAAYTHHIGFYATPTGHEAFAKQLSKYKQGKGSVQFPIDEPMPLGLIKKIVLFRLKENKAQAKEKSKK